MEDLPFLPKQYIYEVIDRPEIKKQIKVIEKLYHRKDIKTLYIAGDPAREGIYIQYLILQVAGIESSIDQRVVWIDSQTDEEIRKGIASAKPRSEYDRLAKSGYLRAIEDYATGINLSRALSISYARIIAENIGKDHTVIAVGRVMSSVLGMVVRKEREIREFVETPFYKLHLLSEGLELEWKAVEESKFFNDPRLYSEVGFKEKSDAEMLKNALDGQPATVKEAETKTEKKYAPNLFNLAELQAQCTKAFKFSPDKTLEIAQSLYEKKLTTYPRTDARVLSTAIAKEIDRNLNGLKGLEGFETIVADILSSGKYKTIENTKYVDDSKVTDHYAIIPTGLTNELSSLSSDERQVFELIVKRFLGIFLPPAEYLVANLVVDIAGESFFQKAKVLSKKGFLCMYKPKEEDDAVLKAIQGLQKGNPINVDSLEVKEGKTSPPTRYTSGSIILAMENAGNLIEDEEMRARLKSVGIGTSATRANIITKLAKLEYIQINSKTQVIYSDYLGEMIYDLLMLTISEVLSPELTAKWEMALDGVVEGKMTFENYLMTLNAYLTKEVNAIKETSVTEELKKRIVPFRREGQDKKIKCPVCGREMKANKNGDYGCPGYKDEKNPCKFYLKGTLLGKKLTANQIEWCLQHKNEPTKDVIKGFTSKEGKKFNAKIKYVVDEKYGHQIQLYFDPPTPAKESKIHCPKCGKLMQIDDKKVFCECGYKQYRSIYGRTFGETELMYLLERGSSGKLNGFYSTKSKKQYSATILYDKETNKMSIQF